MLYFDAMTFDGLTLAAMADELRRSIENARVQKIVQPGPQTIALQMYGNRERHWLLLSADPQRPRLYLTADRPGRGVENPTPLLLLLRKYVDGARLAQIEQPSGERILNLGFSVGGERAVHVRLIIEAISQYSNLILVDAEGRVLDAARRVSAEQNRYRVTLPRHPYVPPPAQTKRSLDQRSPEVCREVLASAEPGGTLWQALVSQFAGLGPLAGREISFRATGDARAKVSRALDEQLALAAPLAEALAEIVEPVEQGRFSATVARGAAESAESIVAFAPYPLTHLGRWEPQPTLSAAADAFYRQAGNVSTIDLARKTLLTALTAERSQAERKRESLLRALEGTVRAEELRAKGELLLTYATTVPRGASAYAADGVQVDLDPRLSAVDNAQALFRRYKKQKAALREVPALLNDVELRLRYLDEIAAWSELAESADAVRALRSELRPPRRQQPGQRKRKARRPEDSVLRLRAGDGTEILVGRSAHQNQAVTFDLARTEDLWLHARGCPGAHVILRAPGERPSDATLHQAAALAAYYSANRASGKVEVDWTRRKHVRHLGKGTPGLVSYSGEQTLLVEPAGPDQSL
ncbi:MAG TPA: NFACT RNA binding domain-containing protein [Chloroflexota bacterium]|nr:NFACT RNA binding domain-containing protein [Chloroflexota bacterium]